MREFALEWVGRNSNTINKRSYTLKVIQCSDLNILPFTVLQRLFITRTRLYNFDLLKPKFYILKLGFTGVYINFRISALNIDCGFSLEPPRRGGSYEYPQSRF